MINIRVKFNGVIRDVTKVPATEIKMAEGCTLSDLIAVLHEKYGPEFR